MHSIDNGFSKERKKDNWRLIAKYLDEINLIYSSKHNKDLLVIHNPDLLVENKQNEILSTVINLYAELTDRRMILTENKKMATDIDDINKSYLLKENGDIELMHKDQHNTTEKKIDEQSKTKNVSSLMTQYKNTNVVMKGEMKGIQTNVTNVDTKNFKINIFEPKESESPTKLLRQIKPSNLNADNNILIKSTKVEEKPTSSASYAQLIVTDNHVDQEIKSNKIKNPFEFLEDFLNKKIQEEYKQDYAIINSENKSDYKFLQVFFKHVHLISNNSLQFVLNEINKMIEEFFNILSEQVNDYLNLFLIIFDAYTNKEIIDEKKLFILHDSIVLFFVKSSKNKSEEMFFILKNLIMTKIFNTMSNFEYKDRLNSLCILIYKIVEPWENQYIDFFKLVKNNIKNEIILYTCFAHFHDLIESYNENLIDAILFYILNGLASPLPEVRYYSLYILNKYIFHNLNFFYNFEKKLEKLSMRETDKENLLLIIKMSLTFLTHAYNNKNKVVNGNQNKRSFYTNEKLEEEANYQIYLREVEIANKIIKNILVRFTQDKLFMLVSLNYISEFLFDNNELYKILIWTFFKCHENIHRHILYDEPLDENTNYQLELTPWRHKPTFNKPKEWNKAQSIKAYDILLKESKCNKFTKNDYDLLKFIMKGGINIKDSEIYKNHFRFCNILIADLKNIEKCSLVLSLLEPFLFCEPISKHIFDDCYESLQIAFREINESDDYRAVKDIIHNTLKTWIPNSSQILKDGLKKIAEVLVPNFNN